jgi:hypothetical protein
LTAYALYAAQSAMHRGELMAFIVLMFICNLLESSTKKLIKVNQPGPSSVWLGKFRFTK